MCGRCASSRDVQGVRHACAYRPRLGGDKAVKPTWKDCSKQQRYYPSYNISPQANTLVLLSGHHPHILAHQKSLGSGCGDLTTPPVEERVLQTMKWGLVPSWHRGESPSSFGTVLNNCRRETILEKPSFRNAIEKGRRCVVVADGFFEWFRDKGQRQPYFIYFSDHAPSEEMVEVSGGEQGSGEGGGEGEGGAEKQKVEETNEWVNPVGRMLTMAGLFDIWKSPHVSEPLYTYTVITVEAHARFAEIHHRMPAVLDGQEAVHGWLDPTLSSREVCDLLHPVDCLSWHPVSTVVNNSRNHTPNCVVPYDISKQTSAPKTTLMNWFSKTPQLTSDLAPPNKQPKLEGNTGLRHIIINHSCSILSPSSNTMVIDHFWLVVRMRPRGRV